MFPRPGLPNSSSRDLEDRVARVMMGPSGLLCKAHSESHPSRSSGGMKEF